MTREQIVERMHAGLEKLIATYREARDSKDKTKLTEVVKRAGDGLDYVEKKLGEEVDVLKAEVKVKTAFWKPLKEGFSVLAREARTTLGQIVEAERSEAKARELELARRIAAAKALVKGAATVDEQKAAESALVEGIQAMRENIEQGTPGPIVTAGVEADVFMRWTYEVVEPREVPREYCEPSKRLILAAVRAGTRTIPGVRIFEAPTVRLESEESAA
jgi:hypothetical protein